MRTQLLCLYTDGLTLISAAERFYVADVKGPLVEGEENRARAWGQILAGRVAARAVGT